VSDRLRALWDFDDLDVTEGRLEAALGAEQPAEGRAEVLTQLARVQGLRGDFGGGARLLDEAAALAGESDLVAARIELEGGRLARSSGDRESSLPRFERAFERAGRGGHWFLAADAAHMAALAAPDRARLHFWTERGLALAEAHEDAAYWAGPLLNNLGWELLEAGELEDALAAFERALAVRERDGAPAPVALAQYAVGKALRALGRSEEAILLLERAVAWADGSGRPDGWFHEELAEAYAAVGRRADAASHAARAIPLLEAADPSFAGDEARHRRLQSLTGSG